MNVEVAAAEVVTFISRPGESAIKITKRFTIAANDIVICSSTILLPFSLLCGIV